MGLCGLRTSWGDLARVRQASERLAWMGRDGPSIHREIGAHLARAGRLEPARRAFERSLDVYPTTQAWLALAKVAEKALDWEGAIAAYQGALALDPNNVQALFGAGRVWLQLGEPRLARRGLERAHELAPSQPVVRLTLERALREEELLNRDF